MFSGGTPSTNVESYWNGMLPWLSSGETRNRFIITTDKTITNSGVENSSTKKASKYDVVIASAGQGFTRGQTSLLLLDTYINQSVISITGAIKNQIYLFANIKQRYNELRILSDGTSTRGSLTTKIIASLPIYVPMDDEIEEFYDLIKPIIDTIESRSQEIVQLVMTRDLLLPRLMSGDIDLENSV